MTQSIVQGPEDPLLVLDHQGGSGNPSFLIQQDENAVAYIWWDQVNQVFNMGAASAGFPSLSIASDGSATIGNLTVGNFTVDKVLVTAGVEVKQNMSVGATANIAALEVATIQVDTAASIATLTAAQANIETLEAVTIQVDNSASIPSLTAAQANIEAIQVSNLSVGSASIDATLTMGGDIDSVGNIVTTGAVTAASVNASSFNQSSSGEDKENIVDFSSQEALEVLEHLSPVKFNYKADDAKEVHTGFIAEDVPRSVASSDGKAVSLTDVVSVLTRVVKEQQKTINALLENNRPVRYTRTLEVNME